MFALPESSSASSALDHAVFVEPVTPVAPQKYVRLAPLISRMASCAATAACVNTGMSVHERLRTRPGSIDRVMLSSTSNGVRVPRRCRMLDVVSQRHPLRFRRIHGSSKPPTALPDMAAARYRYAAPPRCAGMEWRRAPRVPRRWIREMRKRLVGMACDEHVVEALRAGARDLDERAVAHAPHPLTAQ